MITFPNAKINLGLNVVEKRPDGYHNLETVFYPVPITDALETVEMDRQFPSDVDCDLKVTNLEIEGDEQRNLVVRAYRLLKDGNIQGLKDMNINDCMECRCCEYICSSKIPLVTRIKEGKAAVRGLN